MKVVTGMLVMMLGAIATVGCGGRINDNDYDRSCEVDDDCAVVVLYEDCSCGSVTAINVSEVEQLDEDNARVYRYKRCDNGAGTACKGPEEVPQCSAGMCQAVRPQSANNQN